MFKALTPIISIIVAVGLFFTYIRPTFQDVKAIQDETAEYAQAVEKASELKRRIAELKAQQSAIPLADLERLEALLPDRVDEVAALIDVDALAARHNLILGDIKVVDQKGTDSKGSQATQPGPITPAPGAMPGLAGASGAATPQDAEGGAIRGQYATLDIGFSVTGAYNDFRLFLEEIEQSLVLMEVTKITFTESEGDAMVFTVGIRLYSLNSLGSSVSP